MNETQEAKISESIILKKLGLTKRGAFNILQNNELCNRILSEEVMYIEDFSSKYEVGITRVKGMISSGLISHFRNSDTHGSKTFIFTDEILKTIPLVYKDSSHIYSRYSELTDICQSFLPLVSFRQREFFNLYFIEKKSVLEISEEYGITQPRIKQILNKAIWSVKTYRKTCGAYDELRKSYDILKSEYDLLLDKRSRFFRNTTSHKTGKLFSLYTTPIEDIELSVRAFNILKTMKIETFEDMLKLTAKKICEYRGGGLKTVNEIRKILNEKGYELKDA